eukprot:8326868-Prorocentrum_lima.AAC.1
MSVGFNVLRPPLVCISRNKIRKKYSALHRSTGPSVHAKREPAEEAIARFDLLHALATNMSAFLVPASLYPSILSHTDGRIPSDDSQIEQMKASLTTWSHLLEASNPWSIHGSVRQDSRFRSSQGVNVVGVITYQW